MGTGVITEFFNVVRAQMAKAFIFLWMIEQDNDPGNEAQRYLPPVLADSWEEFCERVHAESVSFFRL